MAATEPTPAPPPAPHGEGPAVQLELVRAELRKARAKPRQAPSSLRLPVARVVVDKGLSHLDRYFDYSVPARLDEAAQPGVRVRVRFGGHVVKGQGRREGGTLIDGYIVERRADSDFSRPLSPLSQVLSPEPVLTPELLRLCRAVADRYAGPLADVLQLAIPPKHNRAEAEPSPAPLPPPAPPAPGGWARYPQGPEFLAALAAGGSPRAVWTALPGSGDAAGAAEGWPLELARAVAATLASGRGALVLLPDGRAVARLDAALLELLGSGHHVALTAGLGPEERYRRWLAVSRGSVRAVVGTRAAMFAPLSDLGLVAVWDDGDTGYSDQHVPFPHARDVLLLRAAEAGAGALIGGFAVSVESAQLLRAGWSSALAGDREQVRRAAPLIRTVGDQELASDGAAHAARLPTLAWRTAREALAQGPVLVQVPRRGYVPRLACARCRTAARCGRCAGPLEARDADGLLHCSWCGRPEDGWRCHECGFTRLRAQVVGARRTAEELGRAFPAVPVRTSGRDGILATVPGTPALVVSTPGAEPLAEGGYAAALLLDAWALLNRPDLRAGEEALRRWLGAAALVRPQQQGGRVVIVAEPTLRPVQALVRWDPAGFAATELGERAELGFPPVSRMASLTGSPAAVADLLALLRLPPGTDVLGPVELTPAPGPGGSGPGGTGPGGAEPLERVLLRVAPGQGAALATAVKSGYAARMARKQTDPVRIRIDPLDIG